MKTPYTQRCVAEAKPPCVCACPFNLNVPKLLKKVRAGKLESAYRELANGVHFPAIVCALCGGECRSACPADIAIGLVERYVLQKVGRMPPINYRLQPKKGRAAVIGGGPSGLACAKKLAARRFETTVFERSSEAGGCLRGLLPKELYAVEIALQTTYAPFELVTEREIGSIEELRGFDAIYIATGKGGDSFGLLASREQRSMATSRRGIFIGGMVCGATPLEAIAEGVVAGASIERYLLSGSMAGEASSFLKHECKFIPAAIKKHEPELCPSDDAEKTAVAWAKGCADCRCDACVRGCELLRSQRLTPIQAEELAVGSTLLEHGTGERKGARTVFSCSACGHCGSVCPEGISLEKPFIEAKAEFFKQGSFPAVLHDYYLRDMEDALGASYLASAPGESATYLLFPGCRETQSGAEHVKSAYAFLQETAPDAAVLMGCCGIPALWAGDTARFNEVLQRIRAEWRRFGKPIFVMLCATCAKTFAEYLPEIRRQSLYELLVERKKTPAASLSGNYAVFDPCASREAPCMQKAVRSLARLAGAELSELADDLETARCCGNSGQIYLSNYELASENVKRATSLSELPYITYCAQCRDLFLAAGKPCVHILDSVLGIEPHKSAPHIDELRAARSELKRYLLSRATDKETALSKRVDWLYAEEKVLTAMDRQLISLGEVAAIISSAERSRRFFIRPDSGIRIARGEAGMITCWAAYRKNGEGMELLDTYCHRMKIND